MIDFVSGRCLVRGGCHLVVLHVYIKLLPTAPCTKKPTLECLSSRLLLGDIAIVNGLFLFVLFIIDRAILGCSRGGCLGVVVVRVVEQ